MKNLIPILIIVTLLFACNSRETEIDKSKIVRYDYRLFQNTPSWELAKAVEDDEFEKVIELIKANKQLLNASEPIWGRTLLQFAIHDHKYEMAGLLLKLGADVNHHEKYNGRSAIILACADDDIDPKIISKLLDYGANVNDVEIGPRREGNSTRDTPLIAASRNGNLPLVTYLISKGANVNYQNEYGSSALSEAIIQEEYNTVMFLLKNDVDINTSITYNEEQKKHYYLADELRFQMPDLNSIEHKQKYEIIDFLSKKGIDYSKVSIPKYVIEKAKEKYPKDWQEYLKKY